MAILAVLGAILVPKVSGYKAKAQKSNIQSSAKTLLNSIDAYNSDKEEEKQLCAKEIAGKTWQEQLEALCSGDSESVLDISKIPVCLGGKPAGFDSTKVVVKSYDDVAKIAKGDFTIVKTDGLKSEIKLSTDSSSSTSSNSSSTK